MFLKMADTSFVWHAFDQSTIQHSTNQLPAVQTHQKVGTPANILRNYEKKPVKRLKQANNDVKCAHI